MYISHRGHCMVLKIPRRWIQIEVQFNDIAFHISSPDGFHRGRGWCRLKLWILMPTARLHIFPKCIFRLNDAAHSRCSVEAKDIVSKGPPDFQQMPFLLVRAVKDNLFGPIIEDRTPRSNSVTKWLTSPSQESFLKGQPSASAARAQFSPHL